MWFVDNNKTKMQNNTSLIFWTYHCAVEQIRIYQDVSISRVTCKLENASTCFLEQYFYGKKALLLGLELTYWNHWLQGNTFPAKITLWWTPMNKSTLRSFKPTPSGEMYWNTIWAAEVSGLIIKSMYTFCSFSSAGIYVRRLSELFCTPAAIALLSLAPAITSRYRILVLSWLQCDTQSHIV